MWSGPELWECSFGILNGGEIETRLKKLIMCAQHEQAQKYIIYACFQES